MAMMLACAALGGCDQKKSLYLEPGKPAVPAKGAPLPPPPPREAQDTPAAPAGSTAGNTPANQTGA